MLALVGGVLVVLGGLALMFAIVADLIADNRRLIEDVLEKTRRFELEGVASRTPKPVSQSHDVQRTHARVDLM